MMNKFICLSLVCIAVFIASQTLISSPSYANHSCCNTCVRCNPLVTDCSTSCQCQSDRETPVTTQYFTDLGIEHREWIINVVWEAHVLPAMMLMTEQIVSAATQQAMMIGTLFDAKHQLESQRLLQSMTARAHTEYQPSEGMCQFGTLTRSLTQTQQQKHITQIAMAERSSQRQSLNGDGISGGGRADDIRSRFRQFQEVYCNPADLGENLQNICNSTIQSRTNRDIDFTKLSQANNLYLDFTDPASTIDERDVMAMQANLYGHRVFSRIPEDKMSDDSGNHTLIGVTTYLKMRAVLAKRSIAEAAFAAYVAERTETAASMQPFMEGALREMGISAAEAQAMFGVRPSYRSQMYFLTNTMYQTPQFYADLYDTPENVDRKKVSMQALNLKLRSDMYDTQLRTNAIQAVLLETLIDEYDDKFENEANKQQQKSNIVPLPGLY